MRRPLVLATIGLLGCVPAAGAHVQVTPTQAAPGDAVQFTFLVPNEREEGTTSVALQVPKDVVPFSFEDVPGWKREVEKAADGSVAVVRWTGRLASDGLVRFTFLAATPEQVGPISWKAVQRYAGGEESAWVGPPDSDEPAAVTTISKDVPKANAGGEGETATATAGEGETLRSAENAIAVEADDGDSNTLPIVLGAIGIALGAASLLISLRRR